MKSKAFFKWDCALSKSQIKSLANQYVTKNGDDNEALLAGVAIRQGDHSRENLMKIVKWKLVRDNGTYFPSVRHPDENSDQEIAEALEIAVCARTPRIAIGVLTALAGVGVSVASAVMMAIWPEAHTVIDRRCTDELGYRVNQPTIKQYLEYRDLCRKIADEHGVTLRELDQAFWQKNRGVSGRPTTT